MSDIPKTVYAYRNHAGALAFAHKSRPANVVAEYSLIDLQAAHEPGEPILTIRLPPPAPALWPNGRPHRMAKARAIKDARRDAGIACLDVMNRARISTRAAIDVLPILYRQDRRNIPDRDNAAAALKAYLDGLADAKLVANDRQIRLLPVEFRFGERPRLDLLIFDRQEHPEPPQ